VIIPSFSLGPALFFISFVTVLDIRIAVLGSGIAVEIISPLPSPVQTLAVLLFSNKDGIILSVLVSVHAGV
jgi:hypothetical protein